MEIRDRIKELRKVKASELLPNPKNWRKHPDGQANALRGMLSEIGYADALIAYETPNGLMLIDGHLRAETTPDSMVPVLITDLTEDEADKVLVTLDPLSGMAETDKIALAEILNNTQIQQSNLADMLQEMSHIPDIPLPDGAFGAAYGEAPDAEMVTVTIRCESDIWSDIANQVLSLQEKDERITINVS
jgi:hypothetical protein